MNGLKSHQALNGIIDKIIAQIATEQRKPITRIQKLLTVKHNQGIERRFWHLLSQMLLGHAYEQVDYCPCCKKIQLFDLESIEVEFSPL